MPSVPEKIGRYIYHSPAKSWRERAGRYRIQGAVCQNCEQKIFPPVEVCPYCHSKDLEKRDFAQTGTIVLEPDAIWYPLIGLQEVNPQYSAFIELDDGPVLCAELVNFPSPLEYKEGARVKMVFRKLKREDIGNYLYGFKFKIIA